MKIHYLNSVVIGGELFQYFYTRERNDVNGNTRHRVYIIDPDGPAVHEAVFECYESQIQDRVKTRIGYETGVIIPAF